MAVLRQLNLLSQQRLDVPHLRSLESGVAADFDVSAGRILSGGQALVVRGFALGNLGTGVSATSLQLGTADGIVCNLNASEAGTFLWVPADRAVEILNPATNGRVSGSWTAGQVNYVGIDLVRNSDTTTTDLVQFLDANTLLETPKQVPLARTLDYQIVISTIPFSSQPNLVPIVRVTLDNVGQVTAAVDSRPLLFRLGSGGDNPNSNSSYGWPQGRTESTALNSSLFQGGDKAIGSHRDWTQAAMTRIWEIGGGEHWYSGTADRNVIMIWTGPAFSNGENFEWDGTNLHWKGLKFLFDNSSGYYNVIADQTTNSTGLTNLADGDCVYVDLDRTQNATGLLLVKTALITMGSGSPPGSRQVVAYRSGSEVYTRNSRFPVGTPATVATTSSDGIVRLSRAASVPAHPVVISNQGGTITSASSSNNIALILNGDGTGSGLQVSGGSGSTMDVDLVKGILGTSSSGQNLNFLSNRQNGQNGSTAAFEFNAANITSDTGKMLEVVSGNGQLLLLTSDGILEASTYNGLGSSFSIQTGAVVGTTLTIGPGGSQVSGATIIENYIHPTLAWNSGLSAPFQIKNKVNRDTTGIGFTTSWQANTNSGYVEIAHLDNFGGLLVDALTASTARSGVAAVNALATQTASVIGKATNTTSVTFADYPTVGVLGIGPSADYSGLASSGPVGVAGLASNSVAASKGAFFYYKGNSPDVSSYGVGVVVDGDATALHITRVTSGFFTSAKSIIIVDAADSIGLDMNNSGGSGSANALAKFSAVTTANAVQISNASGVALEVGTGNAVFTASNPAATTAFTNTETPKNIVKSWVKITLNGTASPTVNAGFNIGTVTAVGGGGSEVQYAWPAGGLMATAHYAVDVTLGDESTTSLRHARIGSQSTSSTSVKLRDNSGTLLDPTDGSLVGQTIHIKVCAAQ